MRVWKVRQLSGEKRAKNGFKKYQEWVIENERYPEWKRDKLGKWKNRDRAIKRQRESVREWKNRDRGI